MLSDVIVALISSSKRSLQVIYLASSGSMCEASIGLRLKAKWFHDTCTCTCISMERNQKRKVWEKFGTISRRMQCELFSRWMTTRTRKLTKSRVNKRHSEASLRLVRSGARAASLETADRVSRRREKKRATSRISRLATNASVKRSEQAGCRFLSEEHQRAIGKNVLKRER